MATTPECSCDFHPVKRVRRNMSGHREDCPVHLDMMRLLGIDRPASPVAPQEPQLPSRFVSLEEVEPHDAYPISGFEPVVLLHVPYAPGTRVRVTVEPLDDTE